ncbi:transposase, partial [Acinetobacter baumannii]
DAILADRGEMMSHQVERLVHGYNVRIENAPAYRGDAKGIVERYFGTLQAEFKPYAPGVVKGNRIQKHGESDYRLDAVL